LSAKRWFLAKAKFFGFPSPALVLSSPRVIGSALALGRKSLGASCPGALGKPAFGCFFRRT